MLLFVFLHIAFLFLKSCLFSLTRLYFPPVALLLPPLLSLISGLLCFLWLVQSQRSVNFQKHKFSFQWLPGLYTDCVCVWVFFLPVCGAKKEVVKSLILCFSCVVRSVPSPSSSIVGLVSWWLPVTFLTVLNTGILTHTSKIKLVCHWNQDLMNNSLFEFNQSQLTSCAVCYGDGFALIMRRSSEVQLLYVEWKTTHDCTVDQVQSVGSELIRVLSGAVEPAQLLPCGDVVFYVCHM